MTITTEKTPDSRRIQRTVRDIHRDVPRAMQRDRQSIRRSLSDIQRATKPGTEAMLHKTLRLKKQLGASIRRRQQRLENRPQPAVYPDLPIAARKDDIIAAIQSNPVVIISGETGSGKTTQLPKYCLEAGRGVDGMIGCTQPRRIAAATVARRIAEEFGEDLGRSVGYKIRFQDHTRPETYIKVMTDGILLAETQGDPRLGAYDTIIVDEAHERSLNIDFILGILKQLLVRRKDLKLIITSATIDTEKFSRHFGNAPVIEVSGRMFPVEVEYTDPESFTDESGDASYVDMAVQAVETITARHPFGDILIFMPTEQDIRETCELIEGRRFKGVTIRPLFARLSGPEQARIFARTPGRKIIVATNIAETSITIPGIKYVIDTGLARISQYSPRTRTTSLPVAPISRSSADQRKGRCGRVENGVCIRLYTEADYLSRPLFTPPEILRTNLAEVILRMVSLKLPDISRFPFIDPPSMKHITDGFDLLTELGALDAGKNQMASGKRAHYRLTPNGRVMARLPIDPRPARMLMEARSRNCLEPVLVIASALSIQDPRERPLDNEDTADRAHGAFRDPASDFITLLNIWNRYHQTRNQVKSTSRMRKYCREHFLSFRRMREWRDIHSQLRQILEDHGLECPNPAGESIPSPSAAGEFSEQYTAIHQSILSGFLSNIALKKDKNIYRAAKGREVMIFPGSGLFNRSGTWIMAAEVVETSRVFARTVAAIDSAWAEELGKDLCRYTYLNPRWERNRGEVTATVQVSLFGLILASGRRVSYGRINPEEATDIFINCALIESDLRTPLPFMRHNRTHIDDITDMENRIRRRDLLISEADLFEFYRQRLPGVYDIRTLKHRIRKEGNDSFLRLTRDDLLQNRPEADELAQYPDRVSLGPETTCRCSYQFEPGQPDDGVTVRIPSSSAGRVRSEVMDWLVPGLLKEKITALIKGLPKSYRKQLVPVADTVNRIMDDMPRTHQPLITALGRFIHDHIGVNIPASAWTPDQLPDHLKMRVAVTGPDGREIRAGRSAAVLRDHPAPEPSKDLMGPVRRRWEKSHITTWDFGDLPESIPLDTAHDKPWEVYPALVCGDDGINLRLLEIRNNAVRCHKQGVAALMGIHLKSSLKFLKKQLALPKSLSGEATYFGGPARFVQNLYDSLITEAFARNIRTRAEFLRMADTALEGLFEKGQEKLGRCVRVLSAYHQTRSTIYQLETANRFNAALRDVFEGLRNELDRLVPQNFMHLYDTGRLPHVVRYLNALEIRAGRCLTDLAKDRVRAADVKTYADALEAMLADLSPFTSPEKRGAVEDFHWMIEEYKVSVFAQELKTAVPVSKKRMDRKRDDINRMI